MGFVATATAVAAVACAVLLPSGARAVSAGTSHSCTVIDDGTVKVCVFLSFFFVMLNAWRPDHATKMRGTSVLLYHTSCYWKRERTGVVVACCC